MNTFATRCAFLVAAAAISTSVAAQFYPAPQPWQKVAEILTNGNEPAHQEIEAGMQPLQFRAMSWQVSLVVEGADHHRGAFCQAAVISPDWLITAASCVCSARSGRLGIEAVLEPATSTRHALRVPIASSVEHNAIWLFQDGPAAFPDACLPPGVSLPAGVDRTERDLALINLKASAQATAQALGMPAPALAASSLGSWNSGARGLLMMGSTPTHALLATLADNVVRPATAASAASVRAATASGPVRGTFLRTMDVRSVVLAQRSAMTAGGQAYPVIAPFVADRKAYLVDGSCDPFPSLATSVVPPGKSICADSMALSQSRTGTPVVLDDHKDPLLLGIQGYDRYTSLSQAASVTTVQSHLTPTVAMTALELMDAVDAKQKATNHWRPLHTLAAPGQPECANVVYRRAFGGLDVWELNADSASKRRAFIFRTTDPKPVARGSPRAYHKDDPERALDFSRNVYPDDPTRWPSHLVRDPGSASPGLPYTQKVDVHPEPGYWVSFTDLPKDRTWSRTNPKRYFDSETMSYITISEDWAKALTPLQVRAGDLMMARSIATANGQVTQDRMWGGVVAHETSERLGEMSMRLGQRLALKQGQQDFDPKRGVNPPMDVLVMVFPNTNPGSFRYETETSLKDRAQRFYELAVDRWPDLRCLVKPQ